MSVTVLCEGFPKGIYLCRLTTISLMPSSLSLHHHDNDTPPMIREDRCVSHLLFEVNIGTVTPIMIAKTVRVCIRHSGTVLQHYSAP
jgi:hypothetical protein